ncbi:MAG: hypothetical protein ACJZ9F_03510 [Rhodospirillaceae bacterium]
MTNPIKTLLLAVVLFLGSSQASFSQDYAIILKELSPVGEERHALAQNKLGEMYYTGEGAMQDNIYAHMWWSIAASNGNEEAKEEVDSLSKYMTPSQLEKATDLARECVKKEYKGC